MDGTGLGESLKSATAYDDGRDLPAVVWDVDDRAAQVAALAQGS